ncbi:glyoxalase [Massilimicrobiota sp. An105]|uniref:VOC family protein n=1 Tax=Massilimicrobiota sp. An105 TaxID=1965540 RepID=UPI000B3796A6|nr:VOC family protein [Massilimicrobiota sp. An105]OUQ76227.1 glyoxalase [Massilimicrobiota sp. An105]
MKLKNTVLIVNDLEQSKKFYKHILGLKTILDFHGSVTLTSGIVLQSKEIWKDLIHKTDQEIIMLNHAVELSFETEDIDAFMYVLDQYHVTLLHPLKEGAWGQRVVRFYDLDGHVIEVGESMRKIIKRLLSQGFSYEELAHRLRVPLDYIKQIME